MASQFDHLSDYDSSVRMLQKVLAVCDEKGVDETIRHGIELALQYSKNRYDYCEKVTTTPSPALLTLARETVTYPFAEAYQEGKTKWNLIPAMMSGHLEGKILQSIIMMSRAKNVLEIGMFTGYAALSCAEALPEDGHVVTCEYDPFLESVARGFFDKSPHGKKIEIRIGPANDTLAKLIEEKQRFDVIFIDANKGGYLDYYKTIISSCLLAENGTIVFDNSLYHGLTYTTGSDCGPTDGTTSVPTDLSEKLSPQEKKNAEAIKEVNEYIMEQDNVFKVMLPIRDGLLLVRRKENQES